MRNFESPFHSWPKVTPVLDNNGAGVHIDGGEYLKIGAAYNIMGVWVSISPAIAIFALFAVAFSDANGLIFAAVIAALFAGYFAVWRPVMSFFFGSAIDVRVYPDMIQVRDSKHGSYKNYSRSVPMEFKIEQHQQAYAKSLPRRLEERYRQAVEVVMYYGLKRVVLADFELKDHEKAQSLVLRLQEAVLRLAAADRMSRQITAERNTGTDLEIR